MIDPNAVSTIRVGELSLEPFSLTDNVPHEVGTELKRGTIEDLATFISAFIGSTDGVGFRAISVTDGQTLPTTTQQEFILVGKGTYYNVVGGSTIICTEELNAIVSNGSYWFIGVEIPINVELAGITQFIRDGFINTTPSEDVVHEALALKANVSDSENIANKQNDLTPDGTGVKYSTVDAVNTIDLQKVINVGGYAEVDAGNSFVSILSGDENDRRIQLKSGTTEMSASLKVDSEETYLRADDEVSGDYAVITSRPHEVFFETNAGGINQQKVVLGTPLADAVVVNFPTPSISGFYTLATTDEVVDLTTGQDIAGDKVFLNTPLFNSSIIRVMNSDGNGDGQIENNLDRYLFKNRFGYLQFLIQDSGFATYKSPTIVGTFSNANLTASRTFTLPDATGTIPIVTQTITNGVTDKSPSEDAVYDAIDGVVKTIISDTPTSTNTGGVSEVLMHTYTIAGGKLSTSCMPNLKIRLEKTGTAGTLTVKVRVNTVNDFATATNIGFFTSATSFRGGTFVRNFTLQGGQLTHINAANSSINDEAVNTNVNGIITYDPSVTQYWFISLQNSNAGDTTRINSIKMVN